MGSPEDFTVPPGKDPQARSFIVTVAGEPNSDREAFENWLEARSGKDVWRRATFYWHHIINLFPKIPLPCALVGEEGCAKLVWSLAGFYIELEVPATGNLEWFARDRKLNVGGDGEFQCLLTSEPPIILPDLFRNWLEKLTVPISQTVQFRTATQQTGQTQKVVDQNQLPVDQQDLVFRLRKRAEIRRNISTRKSVQEGQPDRLADLLDEAANEIERLRTRTLHM